MLRTAHSDYGINFFDTADTYGNGRGETSWPGVPRKAQRSYIDEDRLRHRRSAAQSARRGQSELPQKFDRDYMRFAVESLSSASRPIT